ncbi:MAG: porin family protein [Chitinophagales bacterium]
MKKLIVMLALCVAVISVQAQVDSFRVPIAAKKTLKIVPRDRIVLDFLGTNWIHNIPGMKIRWYSRGFNAYFMYDLRIKKSRVSFAAGLGVGCVNIYSNSALTDSSGSGAKFTPISNYDNYKVNKVALTYIDLPLELRIRTNRDKLDQCWKFNIGFKAGIRVDAHTKQTTKTPNQTIKLKPYPDFNLFRLGPTLRIGYSSFNLTAYYGVLGVFKGGRGPDVHEFAVGISFNGL